MRAALLALAVFYVLSVVIAIGMTRAAGKPMPGPDDELSRRRRGA